MRVISSRHILINRKLAMVMSCTQQIVRTHPQTRLRNVEDPPSPTDGLRILVDRIWPRGLTQAAMHLDAWLRDLAPSIALTRWYGHDPEKWCLYQQGYRQELVAHPEALAFLLDAAQFGPVTLVYATRNAQFNDAAVLKELIDERLW